MQTLAPVSNFNEPYWTDTTSHVRVRHSAGSEKIHPLHFDLEDIDAIYLVMVEENSYLKLIWWFWRWTGGPVMALGLVNGLQANMLRQKVYLGDG